MPGGQFTNLKEQARSLGLETRWHEVARAYRAANDLFGDIVKVTPSSKVVGDMALMMVAQGLTPDDVLDPAREIAFPASVVEMLHGDLGQPPGGWPRRRCRRRRSRARRRSRSVRARSCPRPICRRAAAEAEKRCGRDGRRRTSSPPTCMYPKVFADFAGAIRKYGPVSVLPTPVFFYGMAVGDEITIELERGKTLVAAAAGDRRDRRGGAGPRLLRAQRPAAHRHASPTAPPSPSCPPAARPRRATTPTSRAPMPGSVSTVAVRAGQPVKAGDVLLTIEAMKMETALHAPRDGVVKEVLVHAASRSSQGSAGGAESRGRFPLIVLDA